MRPPHDKLCFFMYVPPMANPAQLQQQLTEALPGADVKVLDPMNDGQHLEALVISPDFEGKPMLARHRMVNKALGNAFETNLHALRLITKTPTEMDALK